MPPPPPRRLQLARSTLRHKVASTLTSAALLAWVAACGLATADNLRALDEATGGASTPTGNQGTAGALPQDGNALVVRGTFGPAAVSKLFRRAAVGAGAHLRDAEAIRALVLACTVHDAALTTYRDQLDANGNFTLTLANGQNTLFGCSLLDDTNALLAHLTFQGDTDLEGNPAAAHEIALSGDVDFGRVYYDDTTYEAAVNADTLARVRLATAGANDALDLTGDWQVRAVDFALPLGAEAPCAAGELDCPQNLRVGQSLRALQLAGRRTDRGLPTWALQVWDAPAQADACGGRVGIDASVQAEANLDFSALGAAGDAFAYAAQLSFTSAIDGAAVAGANVVAGYQLSDVAKAQRAYPRCRPVTLALFGGNATLSACGPDTAHAAYRLAGGNGCRDVDTGRADAVQPTASDWASASCTSQAVAGSPPR